MSGGEALLFALFNSASLAIVAVPREIHEKFDSTVLAEASPKLILRSITDPGTGPKRGEKPPSFMAFSGSGFTAPANLGENLVDIPSSSAFGLLAIFIIKSTSSAEID